MESININDLKINTRTLCKISKVINKMEISSLITKIQIDTGDDKRDNQGVVKELLALVIDNLYKAEDEIIEIVANLKGLSIEEAGNIDIIPIIKELVNDDKFKSFFKLA